MTAPDLPGFIYDIISCFCSDWLQDDGRVTSALMDAFRRLDYDVSVEAQVHLSLSSPRSVCHQRLCEVIHL